MKSSTHFLTIGAAMVILFACNKKDPNPTPAPPAAVITIDSLLGTYIGEHKTIRTDYAYGMGQTWLRDTSYTAIDTLYVRKITVDSFELVAPDWPVSGRYLHFAYNPDNQYTQGGQYYYPSDNDDTITIHIYPENDSLIIDKFFGTSGTSGYTRQQHYYHGRLQ